MRSSPLLSAVAAASLSLSPLPAQTSLVAHFRLDETAGTVCNDSSGLGNHGMYMGGAALGQPGAAAGSGNSVDFDGTSGHVAIPATPALDGLLSNFSVAAWVDTDVLRIQRIFGNLRPNGGGSGGSWSFGTLTNGLRFTTLGVQDYNQTCAIQCCQWHHVAVTFDATFQATFYLDGVAVGVVAGAVPSNPPSAANLWMIGVLDLGVGPAEFFDGRIDDVQVYSGTLSAAEVQSLFANPGAPLGGGTLGAPYCGPAVLNSSGAPATITAAGSVAVAANNLTLTASDLPLNSFGFFLTSRTQGFVAGPGGSQGNLCLGGAIGRYVGPGQIKNSGAQGMFDLAIDLTRTPTPTGLVQVLPGETWNFQCWFRDAVGGSATSNFTHGLAVPFN